MPPRAHLLENDLGTVAHPDHLRIGRRALRLVDDAITRPLQDGQPTLGWEGDARFGLYVDAEAAQWVLVRLEADGVYRISTTTSQAALAMSPVDVVGSLIVFLVANDSRRGHDALAEVHAHNAAVEKAVDDDWHDELTSDLVPRLGHALRRDLGL